MKKIISILALLAMLVSSFALMTACGGDETEPCAECVDSDVNGKCDVCGGEVEIPEPQEKETYKVTVKDTDGVKVAGVKVKLTTHGSESQVATTDANGEVSIELVAVAYVKAVVVEVPDGYYKPTKDTLFDEGATEATVTLEIDERVTYKVNVVDEAGNGIAGIMVGICDDLGCKTPVSTGANGVATFKIEVTGAAKVQFIMLEGYEITSHTQDEGGYVHFEDGATEITITLKAI